MPLAPTLALLNVNVASPAPSLRLLATSLSPPPPPLALLLPLPWPAAPLAWWLIMCLAMYCVLKKVASQKVAAWTLPLAAFSPGLKQLKPQKRDGDTRF